jgi:uncharacterized repeat protein (TIGR03803 family)
MLIEVKRIAIGLLLLATLVPGAIASGNSQFEVLATLERSGAQPMGSLVEHSSTALFGTTISGGSLNYGTVFRVDETDGITILHSFSSIDGTAPTAGLTEASNSVLYGTTAEGGLHGFGTAFKITPEGSFSKLIDFTGETGAAKGSVPNGLALHANGSLYGTTQSGGANASGTLFSINPDSGILTTLAEFSGANGPTPGRNPIGTVIARDDLLYGLTQNGGDSNNGVYFGISIAGTPTLSRSFTGSSGNQAGSRPNSSLLLANDGFIYGTTEYGGANGVGIAFRFSSNASPSYEILHEFSDRTGSQPSGSLCERADGAVYGSTSVGGSQGWGVLYKIAPGAAYSVIAEFTNENGLIPGASPSSGLIVTSDDRIWGTTSAGGPGQRGLVFTLSNGALFTKIASFTTALGWHPSGAPISDRNGNLIFPVTEGGDLGGGSIDRIVTNGTLNALFPLGGDLGETPKGSLLDTGTEFIGVTQNGSLSGRGGIFEFTTDSDASLLSAFTSTAGESIQGPLLKSSNGKLYGVSRKGGFANQGSVFSVDDLGTLSRVFSFTGAAGSKRGAHPIAPLVQLNDGTLYGLTRYSELKPNLSFNSQGSLFELNQLGAMSTVIEFPENGAHSPSSALFLASNGNYYATTNLGGDSNDGALIEFNSATQTTTTIASFAADTTGSQPGGPLLSTADGWLYGFAISGGDGFGTIYRFHITTRQFECLVRFSGPGGIRPGIPFVDLGADQPTYGGLQTGSDGLIYGVTPAGGLGGGGVVFRLRTTSPLQDWKDQYLGDPEALDNGDPDRDGLTNLEEYTFGRLPNLPDNNHPVIFTATQGNANIGTALEFPRTLSRSDINIHIEASTSLLGPWTEVSSSLAGAAFLGEATAQSIDIQNGIETIRIVDQLLATEGDKRFLRIRITR